MQLKSFYLCSTFDGAHVRKNTKLSPPSLHNFNVRIPEQRSLGASMNRLEQLVHGYHAAVGELLAYKRTL